MDRWVAPDGLAGCMYLGYTPEDVNRVLGILSQASGLRLVCVWAFCDACGYGGDSDFYIEDERSQTLLHLAGNLWAWLSESPGDSAFPAGPGHPSTWIGPPVTEFAFKAIAGGDDFHNYTLEFRKG